MKRKVHSRRSKSTSTKKHHRKLHHRVISFFKGDGGIYVIFILATAMAGAFALSGGILPQLNPNPSAADEVQIDTTTAKQSSESALQLVDIKIKPTNTPTPSPTPTIPIPSLQLTTPTPLPTSTKVPTPSIPEVQACLNKTAINLLIDESTSMDNKVGALNSALGDFLEEIDKTTGKIAIAAQAFHGTSGSTTSTTAGTSELLSSVTYSGTAKTTVKNALTHVSPRYGLQGTYMRNGFNVAISKIAAMKNKYTTYDRFVSIIFSDGVPETYAWTDSTCEARNGDPNDAAGTNFICFAKTQDPRTDLTDSMKRTATKNKVYVVAMYNHSSSSREGVLKTQLQSLLGTIASKDANYTETDINNPTNLNTFFRNIVKDICTN